MCTSRCGRIPMTSKGSSAWGLLAAILLYLGLPGGAVAAEAVAPPMVEHYPGGDGRPLELRITRPQSDSPRPRAAILLFHGGGWSSGHAWWMDGPAAQFAEQGMVGIAVQYRLTSPQGGVTPRDAVDDALAAMRWVRGNAARLGIDPKRIVAGGGSAGAHLAAATVMFGQATDDKLSARPDALVLWSPAVLLTGNPWFVQLFGGEQGAQEYSPALHVRPHMPPAILFQGAADQVTPLQGAQQFCQRMKASGNRCELQVYPGLGHMFTRKVDRQQEADAYQDLDADADADSYRRAIGFLRNIGLLY